MTAVSVVIAMGVVTLASQRVSLRRVDCIVVPGAMVWEDGRPGSMLAARIRNAVRLLDEGWAEAIVFTGGAGESGPVESEASRAYALRLGAPAARLHVECASHNTYENFWHARQVMWAHGWRSCLVSSDPFHVPRCVMVARHLGLEAWGAPAYESPGYKRAGLRLWYTLRECAAFARYSFMRLVGREGSRGAA